jgi:hypothetical protein
MVAQIIGLLSQIADMAAFVLLYITFCGKLWLQLICEREISQGPYYPANVLSEIDTIN